MFLDGACFLKLRRDGGEWLINIYGSEFNFEGDWPPDDYFLYVNKYTTDGKLWHTISWNANYEAEAAYSSAQWNLGEDLQFDGEEDLSSFTLSNDLVKLEVKPIPSFSKAPYVHPLIIKDFVGWEICSKRNRWLLWNLRWQTCVAGPVRGGDYWRREADCLEVSRKS